jgi:hypothetical protein
LGSGCEGGFIRFVINSFVVIVQSFTQALKCFKAFSNNNSTSKIDSISFIVFSSGKFSQKEVEDEDKPR